MRRVLCSSLCLLAVFAALSSAAWAVERQLAGVRLGDRALDLLDRPGFGQPNFIGPIGTVGLPGAETAGAGAARAGGRSGPTGPGRATRGPSLLGGMMGGPGMRGGMMGGMRGGGMMGGAAMRGGGMPGGPGMRGGGMPGGAAMRGGMRGGRGARGGGLVSRAGVAQPRGVGGAGMYWYYRRASGAVLVLSMSPTGEIKTITLSGSLPYAPGRTSRNIGLASSYMDVIARYGYPDQTVSLGNAIELTYVDHGVRFTLEGMRVARIAIGAEIVGAVEAAPAKVPEAVTPPVGLSPEQLRGYL